MSNERPMEKKTAQQKMAAAFRKGTTLLCLLLCAAVMAQKHPPKNLNEAQKNKKKLNEDIKNLDAVLGQTKTTKNLTILQLQTLNIKISKREELINTINYEIRLMNGQISKTQREIDMRSAELDTLKSRYKKMIRYAYRNKDNVSKLMFVFASDDFNQAYQRIKYMQEINAKRREHADAIIAKQASLSKEKQTLLAQIEEKKSLLTSEEQERSNLSKEKGEQEEQLGKLSARERQLKEELEQKKKDVAALDKKIKEMIQEIALQAQREKEERDRIEREKKKKKAEAIANAKKNNTNNSGNKGNKVEPEEPKETSKDPNEELSEDFASNKGRLPWPVMNGVITGGFGPHEHPKIKDFIINNSGVDITTAGKSASARSIFDGEVTLIAPMPDGEGKIVIVRHGSYLSVYTNLSKVFVKKGDHLKLKQNIGEIAFDTENGVPTMNLQIWKGQTKLNPEDWLYKGG